MHVNAVATLMENKPNKAECGTSDDEGMELHAAAQVAGYEAL